MKKIIFTLLLLAGGAAYTQAAEPAAKDKLAPKRAAAQAKTEPAAAPAGNQAQARKGGRPETSRPAAKTNEEDAEESGVMIDSKSDAEETGRFAAAGSREEAEEPAVAGGLPSSYGQLKGVMNDAGRSLLVFESPDDGSITFVQVTAGKNNVVWKLVDRIPRSLD
ncbi:MAG TPA: hypothetical protein DCS63_00195 [Elusimicrobia bacterium]|nr:hypothetical protein [Elusimicrobiota bacterium]